LPLTPTQGGPGARGATTVSRRLRCDHFALALQASECAYANSMIVVVVVVVVIIIIIIIIIVVVVVVIIIVVVVVVVIIIIIVVVVVIIIVVVVVVMFMIRATIAMFTIYASAQNLSLSLSLALCPCNDYIPIVRTHILHRPVYLLPPLCFPYAFCARLRFHHVDRGPVGVGARGHLLLGRRS